MRWGVVCELAAGCPFRRIFLLDTNDNPTIKAYPSIPYVWDEMMQLLIQTHSR